MFSKITQLLASFRESSTDNSVVNQNLLNQKEKYDDPTASAETAELVLSNLGQQFAAKNVQPVQQIKPNGIATRDGGYIVSVHPQELGIGRWSKEVNPQTVTTKAVEKVLDDFGIRDENLRTKAIAKLGDNDLTVELGKEKAKRLIKTGDFGERDLMLVTTNNLGGVNVKFDAEQVNWLKGLAKLEKVNELATKGQLNQPVTTETTLLGTTAVLNLPKAIELPKLDAQPLLILGAEAAIPLGSIGVTAGGVAWTGYQIGELGYRKWETQTRADALPLPPTILTNKAEEPTKPETTVADKPKPQAQPIPDEADLPKGEIAVRPKTQPQPQTKADNPTSPTSPTENIPSLYKPTQPNLPPLPNLPPGVAEAITGATTVAIGLKAADITKTGKECSYDPIRLKNLTLNAEMKQKVEELANYRQQTGFPKSGYDANAGTVASSKIDGKTFYGHSTINERRILGTDNRELREGLLRDLQNAGYLKDYKYNDTEVFFLTHAETETILKAKQELGNLEGKNITIYVDRRACDSCYKHLAKVAELYKINTLTIISSDERFGNGMVIITKKQ